MNIIEQGVCQGVKATTGPGVMPLGALPGTFSGDLFDCAKKVTGNCGALGSPSPGANAWRDALEIGIDADLSKHHGPGLRMMHTRVSGGRRAVRPV